MARAKNTDRAQARRRHREQTRAADVTLDDSVDEPEIVAPTQGGLRGMFRLPTISDVREDVRIFPDLLLHNKKLWIPYAMLLAGFVLQLLISQGQIVTAADGTDTYVGGILPASIAGIGQLYVTLTLPPTALFVFFIGGFLAPRASYLVGATLGLLDFVLVAILAVLYPGASVDSSANNGQQVSYTSPAGLLLLLVMALVIGILAAGFASWYRSFLRQSQERARQNRISREQQQRLKAKEDAKAAKDAQRQASTASRQAKSVTPASASTSVPPSKR